MSLTRNQEQPLFLTDSSVDPSRFLCFCVLRRCSWRCRATCLLIREIRLLFDMPLALVFSLPSKKTKLWLVGAITGS
jgi:hypothetical protein